MVDVDEDIKNTVVLPCQLSKWNEIKERLNKLQKLCISENIDFEEVALLHQKLHDVYTGKETKLEGKTREKQARNSIFGGLVKFLNKVATIEEKDKFIYSTFPFILSLAVMIEKYVPKEGLSFSKQQEASRTSLNRKFVACALACSFLCLLPNRTRDKTSKLNITSFNRFFIHLPKSSQCAKLKCIIHYFERISASFDTLKGKITFTRQVLKQEELPTIDVWQQCNIPLCPISVYHEGGMENAGSGAIQVDFANRSIGGGTLGRGAVQEEIKFCECPELITSMLFMENMESNEAIIIEGFEQFSTHIGYSNKFQYDGDFQDPAQRSRSGNLENMICAIDAVPFKDNKRKQYLENFLLRDVNKALTGFCCLETNDESFEDTSDEEYVTASETSHDQDDHLEVIMEYADRLSEKICTSSIDSILEHIRTISKKVTSTSLANNVESSDHRFDQMDYLDVDYCEWLWRFRRRSSNLSDVSSRRSSSSTRYSSEFSSEFEDYYEAFQKREKLKNGIIEEEVCVSPINEFASNLIEGLMQVGTSAAAQIDPKIQNFHLQNLPETIAKPTPLKSLDNDVLCFENCCTDQPECLEKSSNNVDDLPISINPYPDESELIHGSPGNYSMKELPDEQPASSFSLNLLYEKFADELLSNFFPLSNNFDINNELKEPSTERNNNALKEFHNCGAAHPLVMENFTCPQCSVCVYQDPIDFFANSLSGEIIQEAIGTSVGILQHNNAQPPLLSRDSEETLCYRDIPSLSSNDLHQISISFDGIDHFPYESHYVVDGSDTVMEPTAEMHSIPGLSFTAADIISSSPNSYSHFEKSLLAGSSTLSTSLERQEKGASHLKKTAKVLSFDSTCSEVSSFRAAADMSFEVEETGARTQFASNLSKDHMMNAYLKVQCKSNGNLYWRRSSEPYQSTQDNFLPFVSSSLDETQQRPRSQQKFRTEEDLMSNLSDELHKQEASQMQGRPRRSSSGFRDPVLSQFAEELMKCNNNVPKFIPNGSRSESADSRRSSLSCFKDPVLASFEDELLTSSVKCAKSWRDSASSKSSFIRASKKRSHSFDVFDKKRPLITRGPGFHSRPVWSRSTSSSGSCPDLTDLYDTAERITLAVVEEAYSIVYREKLEIKKLNDKIHKWKLDKFASKLSNEIMKEAYEDLHFIYSDRYYNASDEFHVSSKDSSICSEYQDALSVVYSHINSFADHFSCSIIDDAKNVVKRHAHLQNHIKSRGRPIATGNWGCGAFGGDPQLKAMLQWMAASYARTTGMSYYAFCDGRLLRLQDVVDGILECNWTVGHLMNAVLAYCTLISNRTENRQSTPDDLLEFLMDILRRYKS